MIRRFLQRIKYLRLRKKYFEEILEDSLDDSTLEEILNMSSQKAFNEVYLSKESVINDL
jgi:hypothetical protein